MKYFIIIVLSVFFALAGVAAYDEYKAVDRVQGENIKITHVYIFRKYSIGEYNGGIVYFKTRDLKGWISSWHFDGKVKVYRDKDVLCSEMYKW